MIPNFYLSGVAIVLRTYDKTPWGEIMYNIAMAKKVRKNVLNYRVIIEKERYDDGSIVYSASCPTLGVFDYGDSIEEVQTSIKDGIESAIEFLTEQGREIPTDIPEESIVTFTEVKIPPKSVNLIAA
ncbi:MAG: hypothetical protein US60_C0015G0045 [Microgenomates group bacterium GW2011_GWC1_37_8]|uniref:HicB-like antitoxin of toxin-antitoxin system domain-containing protein n=1 Tax=Candidatus Woesebacteria bacterium GW2011_GWB1_38_8 TaxID=1618570 RepID=A0A0G0NJM7_9BACT|nr:MAG: hypothetical protein US60_C0015G0045 [Microgenomates group bacterium GW2011_GWC1_37_8]KKQ86084.1 MAG: hypothetical protein UT08_C0002G0106 [Candidatus Woesebacteria bacterium GW2011_GWB1_38_8]